jgi:hypothetical protein
LIGYFKIFAVQAIGNPITLQELDSVNESLLRMVNKELNQ